MIRFDHLLNKIKGNEFIIRKYLPEGKKQGNEWVCGDIFGSKGDSFSYNLTSGMWADFATQLSGANLIDLISKRENITYKQAAEILSEDLNGAVAYTPQPRGKRTMEKTGLFLAPKDAPEPLKVYRDGYNLDIVKSWCYRNQSGYPMAYDVRIEKEDGKKEIIPMIWKNDRWGCGAMPEPRPLYNLDKLQKDLKATVLVSEGCKTADALSYYFPNYVSTTWQNGCKAVKKADFRPLYNRKVILIPDADEVGRKAMQDIAEILKQNGSDVRIADTTDKEKIKKGWDFADAFEEKMPQSEVIKIVKNSLKDYVPILNTSEEPQDINVIVENMEKKFDYDKTYFRCLGVSGQYHYFYHNISGQILEMSPAQYEQKRLVSLAPLSFWQVNFQGAKGVDWLSACDELCRIQEKAGFFDADKIRGCGSWLDQERAVIHLGSSLLVDGVPTKVEDFDTKYIYPKKKNIAVKLQTPLPKEEAEKIIDILRLARWEKDYYADVLAGWLFTSVVCGAMKFRSHLYMIGARGTGKSWIIENVVQPLLGNMALFSGSKNTEAGIRNKLDNDIIPVIIDEAEAENPTDRARLQAIFDLSRQASSEKASAILKGKMGGGGAISYLCRSAFMFASINTSMSASADMSRTTFIKLKNPPKNYRAIDLQKDSQKFQELETKIYNLLDDDYCRCFITRAINMIHILRACHKIIAEVCANNFGSRRLGDQLGMVLAGVWCIKNDNIITADQAIQLIKNIAIKDEKAEEENINQEEECLDKLMFSEVMVEGKKYLLNSLIATMYGTENIYGLTKNQIERVLLSNGIKCDSDYIYLSVKNQALPSKLFIGSEWETGWKESLMRIDGIDKSDTIYFSSTIRSRAIQIKSRLLIKDAII